MQQLHRAVDPDPETIPGGVFQFRLLHQPDLAFRGLGHLERQGVEGRRDVPVFIGLRSSGCEIERVGASLRAEPEAFLAAIGIEVCEGGYRGDQPAVDPPETRSALTAERRRHHAALPLRNDAESRSGRVIGEFDGLYVAGFQELHIFVVAVHGG